MGRLPWQVIKTLPSKANSLATTSDILQDSFVTSQEGKTALNKRNAKICSLWEQQNKENKMRVDTHSYNLNPRKLHVVG